MLCKLSSSLVQQTSNWNCTINCGSGIYCHVSCLVVHNSNSEPCQEVSCIFHLPDPITDFCITVHEDNLSAISMAESLKFTPCTKHIAINNYFCSRVQTSFNKSGDIRLKYISSKQQLANILTKPVDDDSFFKLCHMLYGWWYYFSLFPRKCENKRTSCSGIKLIELIF